MMTVIFHHCLDLCHFQNIFTYVISFNSQDTLVELVEQESLILILSAKSEGNRK